MVGAKIQVFNRRRPSSSISEFSLEVKKKKERDVPVIRAKGFNGPYDESLCSDFLDLCLNYLYVPINFPFSPFSIFSPLNFLWENLQVPFS